MPNGSGHRPDPPNDGLDRAFQRFRCLAGPSCVLPLVNVSRFKRKKQPADWLRSWEFRGNWRVASSENLPPFAWPPSGREKRIYRRVSVVGLTGAFDQLCVVRITSPELLRKGPKLSKKFGSLVIGEYNCGGAAFHHAFHHAADKLQSRCNLKMSRVHLLIQRIIEEAEGYLELGMTQHALAALQRRGKFVHGNARASYLMGEALRELGCFREALFPLERSAELTPDNIHVWIALGWCYKRTGQLDHAIQALEQALDVDGSEAILHYNLACYWTLARNRTLAISYLSQALDIDANFRDLVLDEPDFVTLHQDPAFKLIAGTVV